MMYAVLAIVAVIILASFFISSLLPLAIYVETVTTHCSYNTC